MLVRIQRVSVTVKFSGTSTDFSDGSITLTSDKMETAIEGNGLFLVGDRNSGNVEYTRKGSVYRKITMLQIQVVSMC